MPKHYSNATNWVNALPLEADRDKADILLKILKGSGVVVKHWFVSDLTLRFQGVFAGKKVYGRLYVNANPAIRIGLTIRHEGHPVLVYSESLVINRLLDVALGGVL